MVDSKHCTFCKQSLDTLSPWLFDTFKVNQLQLGVREKCRTCIFRHQAVSWFTLDSETLIIFLGDQKRFRVGKKFYEIFKVQGKYH
jgi:hypothetical protein